MREILFRGKRLDNGEWIEGDLRQDKAASKTLIVTAEGRMYPVDSATVGQYTGRQ